MAFTWRQYTDWAKRKPLALRLADALGRGRGRLRLFDDVNPPARPAFVPELSNWNRHDLAAAWIGHATVLLRVGGMNVLTDPVLATRVGVGMGLMTMGPRRLVGPALRVRELPKLNLILISHAHFDHLDRPTLTRLPKDVPVITAHRTHDLVRDLGFRTVTEMGWGESLQLGPLKITAREVRHWGARTFYDHHRGFNAYLLDAGKRRVLYGGDTAYHTGFRDIVGAGDIAARGVDLAILGIGAYDPYIAAHATPEQAWQMADHCRADHVLAMHHSTFKLSHEPMHEPLQRLLSAAGRLADRVVASRVGASWAIG
ncbi:MAG TPA: MBL fold metallo-hydrolase [Tepidisphaeraceae bacterium]|nr:MBL fold metallo-hydrolase [Tepidisphaeraceae bacterium]